MKVCLKKKIINTLILCTTNKFDSIFYLRFAQSMNLLEKYKEIGERFGSQEEFHRNSYSFGKQSESSYCLSFHNWSTTQRSMQPPCGRCGPPHTNPFL